MLIGIKKGLNLSKTRSDNQCGFEDEEIQIKSFKYSTIKSIFNMWITIHN